MIEIFVAVIGGLALIAAGIMTFISSKRGNDMQRVAVLETRVDSLSGRNEKLWRHNRQLINHIYEGKPPPPPDFPPGLFDD